MYKKIVEFSQKIVSGIRKKNIKARNNDPCEENISRTERDIDFEKESQKALYSYISSKQPSVVISEISLFSAVKIIGVLIGIFLLWEFVQETSGILLSLFFSIFLASVLYPLVTFFEKKYVPKVIAISLSIIFIFLFVVLLLSSVIPVVIEQSIIFGNWFLEHAKFIYGGDFSHIPEMFQGVGPHLQEWLFQIDEYIQKLAGNAQVQSNLFDFIKENIQKITPWKDGILTTLSNVFSSLFTLLLIVVLTFFLLLERSVIFQYILDFFSPKLQKYVELKSVQMQEKVSGWIHGQIILFLFMGGCTWAFFELLDIKYAITIGFIAGVAEFIPYLGPIVTFFVGMPLALAHSWEAAVAVLIFLGIMQFVEGNILIPLIMEKAVGVSGVVTILALLIGFNFQGIAGAMIAIPMVAIVGIFLEDIRNYRQMKLKEKQERWEERVRKN